jgi:hypothetical protein
MPFWQPDCCGGGSGDGDGDNEDNDLDNYQKVLQNRQIIY